MNPSIDPLHRHRRAFASAEDQGAAEALGIHHIILKPATADDLGRALDDLLTKEPSPASIRTA